MLFALLTACERPVPLVEDDASILKVLTPLEACADPAAREAEGPYAVYEGEDWAAQPVGEAVSDAAWGLSIDDFDGDGLFDIFLPNFAQDRLYLGRPGPTWIDATARLLPWEPSTPSIGSAAADADGDGDLDLAVARRGANALYLNDGEGALSLVVVPALNAHTAENRHASWGDLDGDGLPELYFGNFYLLGFPDDPRRNELYHNAGAGAFTDISAQLGPMALSTPANAGGFTDIDRDGDLDLYIVNDKAHAGFFSVLLENDGAGNLAYDQNSHGLDAAVLGMGLGLGDLNDDGLDEVVVTGWGEVALRMSAPDGVWYEAAASLGVLTDEARVVAWAAELVDIDLDADLDLLIAYGPDFNEFGEIGGLDVNNPEVQPNGLYINEGGVFTEQSDAWGLDEPGLHRGFVLADLNRDGYPDIVERDLLSPATIFLSRCGAGRALAVNLRMPGPNTRALGARVRVSADGATLERTVYAGTTGLSSSHPTELLFGLGDAERADSVEVLWPDGPVTTLYEVPTGQALTLTRLE